nr:helix-turn-helix domain-containing protein [Acinetobacter sp. Marseille-Q1620]
MNNCPDFNVYHPNCPSRLFFENMADKWVLFILDTLKIEPLHFNLLRKNIIGISPKVLSQKLKMLERDGFIQRHLLDTRPIKVEYSLTILGKELAQTAYQFKIWAESNMQYVLEAQQKYDVSVKTS